MWGRAGKLFARKCGWGRLSDDGPRQNNSDRSEGPPLTGTSRFHRRAAYTRCLRCAHPSRNAAAGLSGRKWTAEAARVGAYVSDHQQRSDPGDESGEGPVSRLGDCLCRDPSLCSRYREEWLQKIEPAGCVAELSCSMNSGWITDLRRKVRPELLAESGKHKATKRLRQIPCIGPIGAARWIALLQFPERGGERIFFLTSSLN